MLLVSEVRLDTLKCVKRGNIVSILLSFASESDIQQEKNYLACFVDTLVAGVMT